MSFEDFRDSVMTFEQFKEEEQRQKHLSDCKNGNHKFIECDEWERTCLYCGKFEN